MEEDKVLGRVTRNWEPRRDEESLVVKRSESLTKNQRPRSQTEYRTNEVIRRWIWDLGNR